MTLMLGFQEPVREPVPLLEKTTFDDRPKFLHQHFTSLIRLMPPILAFALVLTILFLAGTKPFNTLWVLLEGGIGTVGRIDHALSIFIPMAITSMALLLPFAGGLWNIGIEGQVTLGAVCSMAVLRVIPETSPTLALPLAVAAAIAGGAAWALVPGLLRVFGRIHEIFTGLGLNYVALGLCIWLVFGPWKRLGIASMSGTELLPKTFWLTTLSDLSLAPTGLVLALLAWLLVPALLNHTRFGLVLRAVGRNPQTARTMELKSNKILLMAMAGCGGLAGLAGCLQVLTVYHQLIPSISCGYGYSGLLVTMMASFRSVFILPLCALLAVLKTGAIQLPLQFGLDSSLGGIVETSLALFFVLTHGLIQWHGTRRKK
ncbi:general nucleoside transport system permease protein [Desulfovibrionales bacterium]